MKRKKKYENKRRKTRHKNEGFYRDFRRREYVFIIGKIRKLVNEIPPPYKIREEGTRGRPPSNPRYILTAILIRALFSLSYDDTYCLLIILNSAGLLKMKKVPAATTIQGLVYKIPVSFIRRIISYISKILFGNKTVNIAGDSTGIGTMKYDRWLTLKTTGKRRDFIKLHGIISTDPGFPVFLSAKVTEGTRHDSPVFVSLLKGRSRKIKLGIVILDSGYLSRKNTDIIKMEGGIPIIKGKRNVRSRSKGSIAWKKMIKFQIENKEEFRETIGINCVNPITTWNYFNHSPIHPVHISWYRSV